MRVPSKTIEFADGIQGQYAQRLDTDVGDFVVFRRDGTFAYQLAVVVDDAQQNVTRVVRGADLLDNTPRQLLLFDLLDLPPPTYCHVPVLLDRTGRKLSKQTDATVARIDTASTNLHAVLDLLGQCLPATLHGAAPCELLDWAVAHWNIDAVPRGTTNARFVCV